MGHNLANFRNGKRMSKNVLITWPQLQRALERAYRWVDISTVMFRWSTYLADFLKTNLTKFAVVWVKKRQKACFLSPRSSKIIVTKKKERRKRKSEEKERSPEKKKKSTCCTLGFYNSYFEFLAEKKLFDAKGPLRDNVIKNPARYGPY